MNRHRELVSDPAVRSTLPPSPTPPSPTVQDHADDGLFELELAEQQAAFLTGTPFGPARDQRRTPDK